MHSMVSFGANSSTPSAAQDFVREETQRRTRQIIDEGANDPTQAIAQATTLPLTQSTWPFCPRGQALEGIARANVKKNPGAADQALGELLKVAGDIPPREQAQYVSAAADLYLKMGEKDNAEKAVSVGLKTAETLLDKDLDPDDPNKALKAWWPSADAYRRFVEVETRISTRGTMKMLEEIKDPGIRTVESIMFARSLFGIPMTRIMVQVKTKDNNSFSSTESELTSAPGMRPAQRSARR